MKPHPLRRRQLLWDGCPHPSFEVFGAAAGAYPKPQRPTPAVPRATALHDRKVAGAPADGRGDVVPAPGAPPLWARFYEPGTTTPIFGDRDRTISPDATVIGAGDL